MLWKCGPQWAGRNIGAEKPWEAGYYFWWGDTVGYKRVNNDWVASDGSTSHFSFCEENTPTCDNCAGYGLGSSLNFAGSYGYSWSSVPDSGHYDSGRYDAWYLCFSSSGHGTSGYNRSLGRSVRPVRGFTK